MPTLLNKADLATKFRGYPSIKGSMAPQRPAVKACKCGEEIHWSAVFCFACAVEWFRKMNGKEVIKNA